MDINLNVGLNAEFPLNIYNMSSLERLIITWTNLKPHQIPSYIDNLINIKEIDLSYTNVYGYIPDSIGSLSTLEILRLESNFLNGSIPETIMNLSNLKVLNLNGNFYISGPFPLFIYNMTSLETLMMSKIGALAYFPSHQIPSYIDNLQELKYLDLSSSNLTGSIPPSIGIISSLISLNLKDNNIIEIFHFQLEI